jgi:hypothetical protein
MIGIEQIHENMLGMAGSLQIPVAQHGTSGWLKAVGPGAGIDGQGVDEGAVAIEDERFDARGKLESLGHKKPIAQRAMYLQIAGAPHVDHGGLEHEGSREIDQRGQPVEIADRAEARVARVL